MATIETKPLDPSGTSPDATAMDNGKDRTGKTGPERKHGKSFVYMGLRDCEEALRKIDHHAKSMSREGFARALGHDAPKGRFLHKLDALEKFTLVQLDDENVRLTPLATDMLYAGSEAARTKARAIAFLAYPEFKRVFVECPKNQDHPRTYIEQFVSAKLQIVNEVDRFIKLFVESAHYAGLLEGEPNPAAQAFRLKPAMTPSGGGPEQPDAKTEAGDGYAIMPLEEVETYLESIGLGDYRERSEVSQRTAGTFRLAAGDGKVTVEIDRPVRIVIKAQDLVEDLPAIVKALKQQGFKA
ncbi:MAG: hypothetical protein IT435_11045 [Phycisphaerales bacterium]|nr:hypothetical protein [Phycisphaerales bacterium]